MSELLSVQRAFAAALRQPAALPGVLPHLQGNARRNEDLLAIYRGNAVSNAQGAMLLAYPVCAEVLGEACFRQLARLYWQAFPASEGDLNLYGGALADFLASREDFPELPWLADLARLEWAVHESGMAPDHQPLAFAALAALSAAELAALRLAFQPALCLIRSDWPIASLWQQHQPDWRAAHGDVFQLEACTAETALIYREALATRVCSLPAPQAALLAALQAGTALMPALSGCAERHPDLEPQHALHDFFQRGLVTTLISGDAP